MKVSSALEGLKIHVDHSLPRKEIVTYLANTKNHKAHIRLYFLMIQLDSKKDTFLQRNSWNNGNSEQ